MEKAERATELQECFDGVASGVQGIGNLMVDIDTNLVDYELLDSLSENLMTAAKILKKLGIAYTIEDAFK